MASDFLLGKLAVSKKVMFMKREHDDMKRLEDFVFKEPQTQNEVHEEMKDERKDKSKPLPKTLIKCVKCGNVFAQRPDVREKRIKKFGSAAKLEANYLCRKCRPKAEKKAPVKKKKKKK